AGDRRVHVFRMNAHLHGASSSLEALSLPAAAQKRKSARYLGDALRPPEDSTQPANDHLERRPSRLPRVGIDAPAGHDLSALSHDASRAGFARAILLWGEAGRSTPSGVRSPAEGGEAPSEALPHGVQ